MDETSMSEDTVGNSSVNEFIVYQYEGHWTASALYYLSYFEVAKVHGRRT